MQNDKIIHLKKYRNLIEQIDPKVDRDHYTSIEIAEHIWILNLLSESDKFVTQVPLERETQSRGEDYTNDDWEQKIPSNQTQTSDPSTISAPKSVPKKDESVEVSLGNQVEEDHSQHHIKNTTEYPSKIKRVQILNQTPKLSRILFTRHFNRLALKTQVPDYRSLNIVKTVKKTAAAGGILQPVFNEKNESKTHLMILFDRAPSMVVYYDFQADLIEFAQEVKGFAFIDDLSFDSTDEELSIKCHSRNIKLTTQLSSLLYDLSNLLLVCIVSDSLGRLCTNGALGEALSTLPSHTLISWIHPWGDKGMGRTPISRSPSVLLTSNSITPQAIHLPLVHLSSKGLSSIERWAKGQGSVGLIGKKLSNQIRAPQRPRFHHVDHQENVDHQEKSVIHWRSKILNFSASLKDSVPMQLLTLAACVPGRGLDLDLLYALGKRFCQGLEIKREHIAIAMTSGMLKRVDVGDSSRVVVGFREGNAGNAAREFIHRNSIDAVLMWLVDCVGSNGGVPFADDLKIPVNLLIKAIDSKQVCISKEWNDEIKESLIRITRSTHSKKWKSLIEELEGDKGDDSSDEKSEIINVAFIDSTSSSSSEDETIDQNSSKDIISDDIEEMTKPHNTLELLAESGGEVELFHRGLAGVIAAQSSISSIDGANGVLRYRGIRIEEMAEHSTFEEVVYLLLFAALPTTAELSSFKDRLCDHRSLPDGILTLLSHLPKETHPMVALQTAVSALAAYYPQFNVEDASKNEAAVVRMIAAFPTIVAAFDRLRKGLEVVSPNSDLDHAANFLYMLNGERPDEKQRRIIDVALILHAEHGFNASTFTGRVVGSTMANPYGSLSAAVAALFGPLHGGANERVLHMLGKIEAGLDGVDSWFANALANKQKIMGLGHRVYKVKDPRATVLQGMARDLFASHGSTPLYDMAHRLETIVAERIGSKGIAPNVDFYSGLVYQKLGMEIDLFTPFLAIARISGWGAHWIEQLNNNRIYRPTQQYIGVTEASYVAIGDRSGGEPKAGDLVSSKIKDVDFEMVYCPPGEFWMGSDEKFGLGSQDQHTPRHRVNLTRGYWMGQTQVTQALWEAVTGNQIKENRFKGATRPVVSVSWFDCVKFCNALSQLEGLDLAYEVGGGDEPNVKWNRGANGYRLPTEAEWERAAKAGTDLKYSGSDNIDEVAWYGARSGGTVKDWRPQPVAQKKANAWNLYDMSGNVWEWCNEVYQSYKQNPTELVENPYQYEAPPASRSIRGSCWDCDIFKEDEPTVVKAWRHHPSYHSKDLGLRLLRVDA